MTNNAAIKASKNAGTSISKGAFYGVESPKRFDGCTCSRVPGPHIHLSDR